MERTKPQERSEFKHAIIVAESILDIPNKDPDDDDSVLARQFLRRNKLSVEWFVRLLDDFEEEFRDKGDEQFGLAKHNNTVVQRQRDWLTEKLNFFLNESSVVEDIP